MEEIYAGGRVPRDRRLQLPAAPPAHAVRLRGGPAGGQPDRGAPVPRPGRAARLRRRPRDRHRGVGADRPGQGDRRPGDPRGRRAGRAGRRRRWRCAGTSSAATSSSRSRCTRSRIEENFDIFDFELDQQAMAAITGARPGRAHRPEPGRVQLRPRAEPPAEVTGAAAGPLASGTVTSARVPPRACVAWLGSSSSIDGASVPLRGMAFGSSMRREPHRALTLLASPLSRSTAFVIGVRLRWPQPVSPVLPVRGRAVVCSDCPPPAARLIRDAASTVTVRSIVSSVGRVLDRVVCPIRPVVTSVVTKSMSSSTRPISVGSRSVQVRTRARMRCAQT